MIRAAPPASPRTSRPLPQLEPASARRFAPFGAAGAWTRAPAGSRSRARSRARAAPASAAFFRDSAAAPPSASWWASRSLAQMEPVVAGVAWARVPSGSTNSAHVRSGSRVPRAPRGAVADHGRTTRRRGSRGYPSPAASRRAGGCTDVALGTGAAALRNRSVRRGVALGASVVGGRLFGDA
jgi:hypothetical protein